MPELPRLTPPKPFCSSASDMALVESIFAKPTPPNPETSTIEQRRDFIVHWTRRYTLDLAVEDLLDPPAPEPSLPELPEPGEPMPERLCAFWDGLTPIEQRLFHGGRIWQLPASAHWTRIHCLVDILRAHARSLRDALQMCRFDDGLGRHGEDHARILLALWLMGEPGYAGPRQWRYVEHFEAIMDFGEMCQAPAPEIATIAKSQWDRAEAHALNWMDALRRRLWPMCRAEAPEKSVIAAADEVGAKFSIIVPDELLFPVLQKIEAGARPRKQRRRRHG
jgi:hypothetical protein